MKKSGLKIKEQNRKKKKLASGSHTDKIEIGKYMDRNQKTKI